VAIGSGVAPVVPRVLVVVDEAPRLLDLDAAGEMVSRRSSR
jgi:hypothetical protein